ncbi:exonuclease SbcCD subunit D C-terminal domain-containing protein [Microbacter margulisiae]|uniref:Nuclease SbcCD subunit D n=1 Tax=Microbacter margulisiae TaxID=1350067 RepID=A0A7W5H2F7_9PORP|nr:exonuclease SbcCD subunit D C-terminal domain-containing protein [Microbacter margulisiae]MBB3187382.1 exonuclease SbcD [Microbacter margulisiae]
MKILHTSDWHLGHRFLEQSQQEEQTLFLDWLTDYVVANHIDIVLVSGDIFDVGVPSAQAQKLYYDFLLRLYNSTCREVIITGGNHDAPSTLNAPKELLNAFSVRVVGKTTDNPTDEVFRISVDGEAVIVAAIPYLRDQDIRRAIAAESAEEMNNRYKTALIRHFAEVAASCESVKTDNEPVIAMGHLFAIGGKTSESEQSIYVGNLGDIGASDFPAAFDYVALGHLHRAQPVGDIPHIRYSGSPYVLSFSEVDQVKKVVEVETGEVIQIKEIPVPAFRKIVRIEGSVESCKTQLLMLDKENNALTPWVEVILSNGNEATTGYKEINDFATDIQPEVLKITVNDERNYEKLKSLVDHAQHIKTFTPLDVFRLKCEEMRVDLEEKPEMLDAFNEILQIVTDND